MPAHKKPAGGRPIRDYDPNRAPKAKRRPGQSSAGTRGSRSPGHRGYRPEAEGQAPRKPRWSAEERSYRDHGTHARDGRDDRRSRAAGDRSYGGSGRARYDERPRYGSDRPHDGGQHHGSDRPRYDGQRHGSARPRYDERPRHDGNRYGTDRPRYDADRPSHTDGRPRYRDDAPRRRYGDASRTDGRYGDASRGRYGDASRGRYGDAHRTGARPTRGDGRPARPSIHSGHGENRSDRRDPRFTSRGERPRFRDDRPRTAHSSADRPRAERSHTGYPARDDAKRQRGVDERRADDRPMHHSDSDRGTHRDGLDRPTHRDGADRARPYLHEDVVHDRLDAHQVQADAGAQASFADLGLGQNIVKTLAGMGADHPFPIQAATIPAILVGRNVLGRGRTGSGKTIAFGAPLVESLLRERVDGRREYGRAPHALILAPTRELALQIDRTVQPLARCVGLFTTQIYGGVPQARQVGALKRGVDIVIGTPGRIEDLIAQSRLDLSQVRVAVLDEADLMSELGFLEPMQRLLRLIPADAQKLMFSATLDDEVQVLVDEFLTDPAVFEVAGESQASGSIDHHVLIVDRRDKAEILTSLVDRGGAKTLVFTRTRAYAEMLAEQFDDAGIRAVSLHGDLNQAKRTRSLQKLASGRADVLVATDVAARGIHVDDITLVVQADAPDEYKTYLHRAGRTGRAGHSGTVVTLIPRQRRRRMAELLERAEIDAPFTEVHPGDDLLEELTGRQIAV